MLHINQIQTICLVGTLYCLITESYKFRCTNGFVCDRTRCVDLSVRCDGNFDCVDRSDELNCEPCKNNELRCSDGTCIKRQSLCDQVKNCPNGEDEDPEFCVRKKCPGQFLCRVTLSDCVERACSARTLCPDHTDQAEEVCSFQLEPQKPIVTCREGEFQCADAKQCVASLYVCDGFEDCEDGSDEMNCPSASTLSGQPQHHSQAVELNEFKCPGGLSIPLDWVCDGRADCPGGEDEEIGPSTVSKCVPKYKGLRESPNKYSICPKGTVQCGSVTTLSEPKCIDQSKLCDGTYDCPDFADELTGCDEPCEARGQFTCRTQNNSPEKPPICIPRSAVCNGIIDCPNGDDEMEGPRTGCTTPSCAINNGGCSQLCEVIGRQVKCSCNPGYFGLPESPQICVAIGDVSVLYLEEGQLHRRNFRESHSTVYRLWADVEGNEDTGQLVMNEQKMDDKEKLSPRPTSDPEWHPILQSFDYALKPGSETANQLILVLRSTGTGSGLFATRTNSGSDESLAQLPGSTMYWFDTLLLFSSPPVADQRNFSVAYDWVHDLVYWADASTGNLGVVNRKYGWKRTLLQMPQNRKPSNLVCDPRFGRLYYITRGTYYSIETVDADGQNVKPVIGTNLSAPAALTMDYLEHELYWIDINRGVIEAYNLRTQTRRMVLGLNTSQHRPVWIDVFEDWVYWSDAQLGSLMRANKRTGAGIQALFNIARPSAFRIEHELLRAPLVNRCLGNTCQQLCLPVPLRSYPNYSAPYQCACDDQWSLKPGSSDTCVSQANHTRTSRQGNVSPFWKMRAEAYHGRVLQVKATATSVGGEPRTDSHGFSPLFILVAAMLGACLFGMSLSCLGHYTYRAHVQRRLRKRDPAQFMGNEKLTQEATNDVNNTEEQLQLMRNQPPSTDQAEVIIQSGYTNVRHANEVLTNI
ncbi:hypothetical protein CRM22_000639 [Opisthorchis felineus]|uniref:EGF-like domain-containing protein n=1 Tax=Opisthorchis felineus TaxID=147828 RepID=A0A4S2ME77_OPIFE|nr:hypothetical protein CRM22_000639 [Opisthorchis felineus]